MNKYIHYSKQIKRKIDITLEFEELFYLTVKFLQDNPEVKEAIFKNIDNKYPYKINCPFPSSCNRFPCETLYCGADTISVDGRAYRMS